MNFSYPTRQVHGPHGRRRRINPRRGATLVTVLILLPVLCMLAAMAVNLAYIQAVNAKVQIVADAATRAAGNAYSTTGDEALALTAAQQLANLNPVESTVIPIAAADLEFGVSQRNSKNEQYTFTAGGTDGNSVRLSTSSFAAGAGTALTPVFPIYGQTFDIRPNCSATHTQTTLDVGLVVDRSGSMRYASHEDSKSGNPPASDPDWQHGDPVPPNSRWLDLVAAVGGFCHELDTTAKVEKVSLSSYADLSSTQQTLTDNYSEIDAGLNGISSAFHGGMTNVGDGIMEGLAAVSDPNYCRPWANNALIVLSDGNHNTGTDPIVAAQSAADEKVPIYTVSFSDQANQTLMRDIANMTGGRHYHAVDAAQLNQAFRDIARSLPSILTQ